MPSTASGFRYPAGTDRMADADVHIHNLADDVQSKLAPLMPEAWRSVGAAGQPAFQNGWGNLAGQPLEFRKAGDMVQIRGQIAGGTPAAIFVLPAGYRPPSSNRHICEAGGPGVAAVSIDGAGNVTLSSYAAGGTNARVCLNIQISVTP